MKYQGVISRKIAGAVQKSMEKLAEIVLFGKISLASPSANIILIIIEKTSNDHAEAGAFSEQAVS